MAVTASGVLSYRIPLRSYRNEPGGDGYPTAIGSLSPFTSELQPNTQNLITGFEWDNRTWSSETTDNILMTIPQNWDPTVSGVTVTNFQSGIGSNRDLEVFDIIEVPSSGLNRLGITNLWSPEVNHGYYYQFNEEDYLFSDDSQLSFGVFSGIVYGLPASGISSSGTYTLAEGFSKIDIGSDPLKVGVPVRIDQYSWNELAGSYSVSRSIKKRVYFTGKRDPDSNALLETWDFDRDTVIWDAVDRNVDEFIIVNSGTNYELILNKNFTEQVGSLTDLPNNLEVMGISTGDDAQQFHLAFAPIDRTSPLSVYSYLTTSGIITTWSGVSFEETIPSGVHAVKVDYDLGILEFADTELASGALIPGIGHTISATYYKTVKAEYELENTENTVLATEVNINPIYRRSAQGFIYLKNESAEPTHITLKAENLESLGLADLANLYGPLYIGNAFATLIATVFDSNNISLEDQLVTFFITTTPSIGNIGSSSSNRTRSVTDLNGQARAFYTPPRTIYDLGEYVLASNWSSSNNPIASGFLPNTTEFLSISSAIKLNTHNLSIKGDVKDIYLYEVRIDDQILGYRNLNFDISEAAQTNELYKSFFDEEDIFGVTGLTSSGTLYTGPNGFTSADWESERRLTWDLERPNIFGGGLTEGRKVLVAQLDPIALDPHTITSGISLAPALPIEINKLGNTEFELIYDTSISLIPQPTASLEINPSGTLYSYFVVAPTNLRIQASVFNRRLNRNILSNEIEIELRIPTYLKGTWIIDAINQNHINEIDSRLANIVANNQRMPLGFRLRSSNITLASALDGVTFLDINPEFNSEIFDVGAVFSGLRLAQQMNVI